MTSPEITDAMVEADPEGRMPFDVALWITEVAEQLGIKSREELAEASPVQHAAPSGEGE